MFFYEYKTKFGKLTVVQEKDEIVIFSLEERVKFEKANFEKKETDLIKKSHDELLEYFKGNLKKFSVKLNPKGTDFQKKVWQALIDIPYGETKSYKDIAKEVGNEKAYRAVGNANNKNPIVIIIPCHRVLTNDGGLGGYAHGTDMKTKLLELEKQNK